MQGNVYLLKIAVSSTPEIISPGGIQHFNGFIFSLQPVAKTLLCICSVIQKTTWFIVELPTNHARIVSVSFGQLLNHLHRIHAVIIARERGMLTGTVIHFRAIFVGLQNVGMFTRCLLYTSDAADEEDSVDLGGRRIIKKKKK